LGEFRIPSTVDVPAWRTVLVEGGSGVGALGVKSVGELSNVPTAAAIASAVADAAGVRVRDLPITAEKVYALLHSEDVSSGSPSSSTASPSKRMHQAASCSST